MSGTPFYNEWLDHIQDIANAYLCDIQEISTNNPEEGKWEQKQATGTTQCASLE
jgi:hypothetical protein